MATQAFHFRHHKQVYPSLTPTRPDLSAAGKTILITGGGKSIGLGITESFALAKATNIVILGREQDALNNVRDDFHTKYPDTTIWPYAADITDGAKCGEVFAEVKEKVGTIDVMVLNAAYLHTPVPFPTMDMQDFWHCFEVNVKANTSLLQLFLQHRNPNSSTIVNVSSYMAWLGALPFPAQGYSASKAAFDVVVGYLGAQEKSVRVFTMHPGSVVTPMLEKVGSDTSREGVFDDGEFWPWLSPIPFLFTRLWSLADTICDHSHASRRLCCVPRVATSGVLAWEDAGGQLGCR
jgi:NAD(P)-dependent dehydrogenase (short-subunit alcohol dehydrogenase family)